MCRRLLVCLIIALLLRVEIGIAEDCSDYSGSTHFVDRVRYPSDPSGLAISVDLQCIDVDWPYAYAAGISFCCGYPYFHVLDISDPLEPIVLSQLVHDYQNALDIASWGTTVYTASTALNIVDVSDAAQPVHVAALNGIRAFQLAVVPESATRHGRSGVYCFDVSKAACSRSHASPGAKACRSAIPLRPSAEDRRHIGPALEECCQLRMPRSRTDWSSSSASGDSASWMCWIPTTRR